MATLDQAIEQMYAAGMPNFPDGIPKVDAERHRYGPKKRAFYKLYLWKARNGREYVAGYFGYWGLIEITKIRSDFTGMEPDERERLLRSQVAAETKEREKKHDRAHQAANRARAQWHGARAHLNKDENAAYLAKKRLAWQNGLRLAADGTLLVPMIRYDVTEEQEADPGYTGPRRLVGLQKIAPDGMKKFNKGMNPVGAACRFGKKPKDGELLIVGEGLATVLSVAQGLELAYTFYVAFTAGNLLAVARILRSLFPKSPILFIADDDAYLEAQLNARLHGDFGIEEPYKVLDGERALAGRRGRVTVHANIYEDARKTPVMTVGITEQARDSVQPGASAPRLRTFTFVNAGRTKAWEAAGELGDSWVVWPRFAGRELKIDPSAPRLTDFNDLHLAEGIERVVDQVGEAIRAVEDAYTIAAAIRDGTPAAAEGASGGGKGGGDAVEFDWRVHGSLVNRFTLIERSDTAYDAERGFLWRISHMRLSFGAGPVAAWLGSKRRRTVDLSQVVFDPIGETDPKTTVNLFRGLELKPKPGRCEKLIELLRYLCGEDEASFTPVSDQVLKWCAYLLQNVGAKMRWAIVMYGPERTGKNLFWGALRKIFGRYGALITQSELEDKHNTWMSAKLFIIANEVVTRAELSHLVGKLKHMVTEDEIYINPKMVDQRYERNHCNLVFLSNELQPLKIFPGDERYLVIRTPPKRSKEFYREVGAELKAGGAEALWDYLLRVDLGDFNEYTVPITTPAKEAVIETGMMPSQLFWQEIKDELLPFPYGPALADDVYRAYTIYCARNGHRNPEPQNKFTPSFMTMNGVRRVERPVPDPEQANHLRLAEQSWTKRRVFMMGKSLSDPDAERKRMVDGVIAFRRALKAYAQASGWRSGDSAQAGDRARAGNAEEPY